MVKIGIIDYGVGNIFAIANVYKKLNIDCVLINDINQINSCSGLILPGVGSFDRAMSSFVDSKVFDDVVKAVCVHQIPILGICVGMQMMLKSSEEGVCEGLGWIAGTCRKIGSNTNEKIILPHMGWNAVEGSINSKLIASHINNKFYFLHSYKVVPDSNLDAVITVNYYEKFTCGFECHNIFGVQFHPEKSHEDGVRLLNNFANINLN